MDYRELEAIYNDNVLEIKRLERAFASSSATAGQKEVLTDQIEFYKKENTAINEIKSKINVMEHSSDKRKQKNEVRSLISKYINNSLTQGSERSLAFGQIGRKIHNFLYAPKKGKKNIIRNFLWNRHKNNAKK